MPTVFYPAIPGPTAAPFQPSERRLLSTRPGPRQSRPLQRDRKAGQQFDFVFTHAELAIFNAWLEGDLVHAGAWFAASWPQPQGGVGVRRFVAEPSFPTYYPGIGWHVSAEVEVRGRGELPDDGVITVVVDLHGRFNAGTSPAVGVAVTGLDPARVYSLSLPAGLTYPGGCRYDVSAHPNEWNSRFRCTTSGTTFTFETSPNDYPSAEASRAAFASDYPGASITGYSAYTFWIYDTPNADNDGGLSISITG